MPLPKDAKIQEALEAQRLADEKVEALTQPQRQVFNLVMAYVKPEQPNGQSEAGEGEASA